MPYNRDSYLAWREVLRSSCGIPQEEAESNEKKNDGHPLHVAVELSKVTFTVIMFWQYMCTLMYV